MMRRQEVFFALVDPFIQGTAYIIPKSQCLKVTEKVSSDLSVHFDQTKINLKWSIWRVFEYLKLAVKQCYQTGQFCYDKKSWKMPKSKNSNATF